MKQKNLLMKCALGHTLGVLKPISFLLKCKRVVNVSAPLFLFSREESQFISSFKVNPSKVLQFYHIINKASLLERDPNKFSVESNAIEFDHSTEFFRFRQTNKIEQRPFFPTLIIEINEHNRTSANR